MPRSKPRSKRRSDANRLENLLIFIQFCFHIIEETDMKEVCNMTGLSLTTIYRLAQGRATLATHYGTVLKLANAAGLWLDPENMAVGILGSKKRKVRVRVD